jgi:hypothetical protein
MVVFVSGFRYAFYCFGGAGCNAGGLVLFRVALCTEVFYVIAVFRFNCDYRFIV